MNDIDRIKNELRELIAEVHDDIYEGVISGGFPVYDKFKQGILNIINN